MQIETAGHYRSQWGEGPIWWNDRLYYVDIEGHSVISFDPATGQEQSWNVGERVGTVVPRASGGLVIAGDHGFHFFDPKTGTKSPIADPEPSLPDNRFNDGKCSPDGRFFAGSISLVKKTGSAQLYRLDPDQSVHHAYGPVTNSNGIGWSPDGSRCYYIDTPRREIIAFDYHDGALENPQRIVDTSFIDASPDGLAVDAENHIWVAFCHGACIICFDPTTGKTLQKIDLPCLETTACAFGGSNLSDLYITTGIHKTETEELAGQLLIIPNIGVSGLPANTYAG